MSQVHITALICTWNRAADLADAIESVLAQNTGEATYEILIVDNNSSDNTREVVARFEAMAPDRVRYLLESRQGKSFALNRGLEAARGEFYLIMDDDLILTSATHLRDIVRAFHREPEVSFVGGRALPFFRCERPSWLDEKHWAAIAMSDRGENEIFFEQSNAVCLLAGAFRTADARAVGGYRTSLSVNRGQVGGVEDDDLFRRLYDAGKKGLYDPRLSLLHKVEPYRVERRYHRQWHTGHGRFYAIMRDPLVEASSRRLFDVPLHLYRAAAADLLAWMRHIATGRWDEAFYHETRLRFFQGFWRERTRRRAK